MTNPTSFSLSEAHTLLSFQKNMGVDSWLLAGETLQHFHTLSFEKNQDQGLVPCFSEGFSSLDDLRHFIASLHSPLKTSARHCVFGTGVLNPRLMIISDAPNSDEDRAGTFFEGESGSLLKKMLENLGYGEKDLYMTSILPYKLPSHYTKEAEEIDRFGAFIHAHIDFVDPEMIILLGGTAIKTVLKTTEGVMTLRGKSHVYESLKGKKIPLMSTFHPHYLLRAPLQKKVVWQDFLTLKCEGAS